MEPEAFHFGRRPELDGIRGLSVLAVIAWHAGIFFVKAGNIGVDVFFVLSGFLISTLLFQEWSRTGQIDLKAFYARRALRLFPVLFVVMTLYACYAAIFESGETSVNSFEYIAATLFYVANWVQVIWGIHHPVLGHTWSLAIEEQFYLLYPAILLLALRFGVTYKKLLSIFGILVFAVVLNRFFLWEGAQSYDRMHMSLDTRADALLIGCFVSVLAFNGLLPKRRFAMHVLALAASLSALLLGYFVITGVLNEQYYKHGIVTLTAICVGVIIACLMNQQLTFVRRMLQTRILVWTGTISYGLYLWHIPVFFLVGRNPSWSGVQIQSVRLAAVFAVAAASYYLIEKPFLRLKDRLKSSDKVAPVEKSYEVVHVGL